MSGNLDNALCSNCTHRHTHTQNEAQSNLKTSCLTKCETFESVKNQNISTLRLHNLFPHRKFLIHHNVTVVIIFFLIFC